MGDGLEKLAEFEKFGVPHIWLVDPRRRKAFRYQAGSLNAVTGDALVAGEIRVPLEKIFQGV